MESETESIAKRYADDKVRYESVCHHTSHLLYSAQSVCIYYLYAVTCLIEKETWHEAEYARTNLLIGSECTDERFSTQVYCSVHEQYYGESCKPCCMSGVTYIVPVAGTAVLADYDAGCSTDAVYYLKAERGYGAHNLVGSQWDGTKPPHEDGTDVE